MKLIIKSPCPSELFNALNQIYYGGVFVASEGK
jgi:hypothetical protein